MFSQTGYHSYYLTRTKDRRNSIYCSGDGQKAIVQSDGAPMGAGSYGKVYRTINEASSEKKVEAASGYVVKHINTRLMSINNVKREVALFQKRYGFGEAFQIYDDIARVVMLELPGEELANHFFTDELDFLHIFILAQIETYFLHTVYHIMHGDLNFSNLRYSSTIGVFHCDFGLSRTLGTTSDTSEETAGILLFNGHPDLGKNPPPLASTHFDVYHLAGLISEFDKVVRYNNTNKDLIAKDPSRKRYIKYDEKEFQKPLARESFLKEIYDGMTNRDPEKQWDLKKSISESIKLYNSLQSDSTKRMSLNLSDYKPASIPLSCKSFSATNSDRLTQDIPRDALSPIRLNYQPSIREKKVEVRYEPNEELYVCFGNEEFDDDNTVSLKPASSDTFFKPAPTMPIEAIEESYVCLGEEESYDHDNTVLSKPASSDTFFKPAPTMPIEPIEESYVCLGEEDHNNTVFSKPAYND